MKVKVNVSDSNFSPSIAKFSKSASCKATLCNISVKFATLFVFANATIQVVLAAFGGFQLEFVSISRVINHRTFYKFECSHWLKLQHSDWRANPVRDFLK